VRQVTPSGTYSYLVDRVAPLPVVIREEGPEGAIDYVHGGALVSATGATVQYFYQFDGVGSVVSVTDAVGVLKAHYAYDPWGNPLWADPLGAKNKYRFTGEPWDAAAGLYHFRARFYDPALGRFLSRDQFTGLARDPSTQNPYQYALNSPLMLTDRTGRIALFALVPGLVGAAINDAAYLLEVATGPEIFSWSTLAGRTAGGFTGAYAFRFCGGACGGAAEYLADQAVQQGVSRIAETVSGTSDPRWAAEDFSFAELATQTLVGLVTGPVSAKVSGAIGPNVGRKQKVALQGLADELIERIFEPFLRPGTALAPTVSK